MTVILETAKLPTWKSRLTQLNVGEQLLAKKDSYCGIYAARSELKRSNELEFECRTIKEGVLAVRRIK